MDRINCKWDAQTMREAAKMESDFAHQIDVWVEYDTTEFAFRRLQEIAFSLENEPQWIEKNWIKEDSWSFFKFALLILCPRFKTQLNFPWTYSSLPAFSRLFVSTKRTSFVLNSFHDENF